MPAVNQSNGRFRGTLVAMFVVFWSLVSWCFGRWLRGALVAAAAGGWSLAPPFMAGTGGRKSGCAEGGLCDSVQLSGLELSG
jgi:hypothetical protein